MKLRLRDESECDNKPPIGGGWRHLACNICAGPTSAWIRPHLLTGHAYAYATCAYCRGLFMESLVRVRPRWRRAASVPRLLYQYRASGLGWLAAWRLTVLVVGFKPFRPLIKSMLAGEPA